MITILSLSSILPNPRNPRKTFLQIPELAETIRERGLIQPITVRLITGYVRYSCGTVICGGVERGDNCKKIQKEKRV